MRRAALSLTLALALGASVVPVASAAFSVIDQSQEDGSGAAGWDGPFPMSRIGQTFTAGLTGDLVAIGLYVSPGESLKDAVLEVRDVDGSLPGDLLLTPKTIGSSADGWIRVPVGPLHLVSGERYSFLLRSDVGSVIVGTSFSGGYPGGDFVRDDPGTGPRTFTDDLAFRTYMAPSDFEWVDAPAPGKALRPNAGATVKASFRLGGDYGLGVLKGGFPKTTRVKCGTTKVVKGTTFLTRPFGGSLSYDDATDTYTVSWNAKQAWAKGALACRQLEVLVRGQREIHTLQYRLKPVLPPR
jgi:hypothetical protein